MLGGCTLLKIQEKNLYDTKNHLVSLKELYKETNSKVEFMKLDHFGLIESFGETKGMLLMTSLIRPKYKRNPAEININNFSGGPNRGHDQI